MEKKASLSKKGIRAQHRGSCAPHSAFLRSAIRSLQSKRRVLLTLLRSTTHVFLNTMYGVHICTTPCKVHLDPYVQNWRAYSVWTAEYTCVQTYSTARNSNRFCHAASQLMALISHPPPQLPAHAPCSAGLSIRVGRSLGLGNEMGCEMDSPIELFHVW